MTPLPYQPKQAPDRPVVYLVHRACGHVAYLINRTDPDSRARIKRMHHALQAAGYFQFRVRTGRLDDLPDSALETLAAVPCNTCRVDPTRLGLAADMIPGGAS